MRQNNTDDDLRVMIDDSSPIITLRALVLGVLTIAVVFYYVVHIGQGMRVGSYVKSQFPMTVWIPFVLWLLVNAALKRLLPRLVLRRGEILAIFTMLWVVGTIPQDGWINYWISVLTTASYFASPENQWAETIFDFLPWNLFPPTAPEVIDAFWLGLPEGAGTPWIRWLGVINQWLLVSVAMVVVGFCLMVLFQRHWVEGEKLTFPLAQMPLDLTQGLEGSRRIPDIFSSRLFQIGVALVLVPTFYNIGTYFAPGLPTVDLYFRHYNLQIEPGLPLTIWFRVMPLVLAVAYLCPLDILSSLIFFYWISLVKEWAMWRVGFTVGDEGQQISGAEILYMESYGALLFVALWSIWLARRHLRNVWHQVRTGEGEKGEILHYRLALIGLVLSAAYVINWSVDLGMSLTLALGTFVLMTLVYFVTVKLIAATGFAYLFPNIPHVKGESFIVELVGSIHLSQQNLVAFKMFTSHAFFGTFRIPAWPAIPHHLRVFSLRHQPGLVTATVLIAFPVGFLVAVGATIEMAYDSGASVVLSWEPRFFNGMVRLLNEPTVPDLGKWAVWLLGFFEAAGIAFLRARFHWFPFHPIGLAFQHTFGTWLYWFSLLLVCIVKLSLLRYGGVRAYQATKPLFYGLAIGYVVGVMLSVVADLIWFPEAAHFLHRW